MPTSNQICDLRSDTVTQPSDEMRTAMAQAEVGDDVFGEDPSVNALENYASELLDKQSALFVSSGTQGNLLALLSQCERGDEYIAGQHAHIYRLEAGGAAVLGSIQPQPLEFEADGTLALDKIRQLIKPDDFHFARTKLLCLENTQHGKVLPLHYLCAARQLGQETGLKLHLDGARLFNAAVKLSVPARTITDSFDTVTFCLSKGLGAPAGSMLCGESEVINKARRWRKMLGGGMRQSGILAAAGLIALKHHVDRLADDHQNAITLAESFTRLARFEVDTTQVHTNMMFVHFDPTLGPALRDHLRAQGILISLNNPLRLVTHLGVTTEDIDRVIHAFTSFHPPA